ncbi:MAG: hypothetical protein OQK55_09360 [Thermoanaerobaculales bacterium]|nr:hypothetical protein [Thermoanaerobaculales bacterium]
MRRVHRFASMTLALVIAAALFSGSAQAADKTDVKLTLTVDSAGTATISVDPEDAKIWRNKPDKPKKVYWKTENNSSHDQLFWELRYDPSKGGGTANYFGDVDIKCGETRVKVQPDKKPDFPKAEWPYSITVFACKDGVKAQEIATVDPRIIWQD